MALSMAFNVGFFPLFSASINSQVPETVLCENVKREKSNLTPSLLLILMCINVQMLLIFINTINVLNVLIATWCYMFTK